MVKVHIQSFEKQISFGFLEPQNQTFVLILFISQRQERWERCLKKGGGEAELGSLLSGQPALSLFKPSPLTRRVRESRGKVMPPGASREPLCGLRAHRSAVLWGQVTLYLRSRTLGQIYVWIYYGCSLFCVRGRVRSLRGFVCVSDAGAGIFWAGRWGWQQTDTKWRAVRTSWNPQAWAETHVSSYCL